MWKQVESGVRGLLVEENGIGAGFSRGLFEAVCRQEALEGEREREREREAEAEVGRSESVNLRAKAGGIKRLVERIGM